MPPWASRMVDALLRTVPPTELSNSLLAGPFSMSTQFSGLGTVEQAVEHLTTLLQQKGLSCPVHVTSACDLHAPCQRLLFAGACHVFTDILEFTHISPGRFARCKTVPDKVDLVMTAKLSPSATCAKHNKKCPLEFTDVVCGGSPCTDYSLCGKQLRCEGAFQLLHIMTLTNKRVIHCMCSGGPTFQCFLSWSRWVVGCGAVLAVHENVPSFPDSLVEQACTHRPLLSPFVPFRPL